MQVNEHVASFDIKVIIYIVNPPNCKLVTKTYSSAYYV
jgi:hypothetical protein